MVDRCKYCGQIADTVDHLQAKSRRRPGHDVNLEFVLACRECNSTLNDYESQDYSVRRRFLFERYTRKFGALLKTPDWADEELAEVGEDLRGSIIEGLARRDLLRRRLFVLKNGK